MNSHKHAKLLSQTITIPGVTLPFVQNYTYDSLNRLESAEEKPSGWSDCTADPTKCWKQTFKYDRYGNRNFNTAGTNTTTLPANFDPKIYNPTIDTDDNRFEAGQGYSYDAAGNTTRDAESRKFTYDAENKQTKVETVDGSGNPIATVGEYFYDGDGKRVKKVVPGGETTIFVYDAGGKLIGEYSTVVQPVQDAKTVYTTNDHLGSPRINTDATGQVISRHDYHPFGEEIARTGYGSDTIRKQFTGYERDGETGLDHAQARMYRGLVGRFQVPDPLLSSGKPTTPQSWNRYAYVLNQPLRLVDPSGLEPFWASRTVECSDGSGGTCRQFMYFKNNEELETYNGLYPGFEQWNGPAFFLTGVRQGFALGSGGKGLDFSLNGLSNDQWNGLVQAQESGQFTEEQLGLVTGSIADTLQRSAEFQEAGDAALNVATLGAGGTARRGTREIALGIERLGERLVLRELAENTGAATFRSWASSGLSRRSVSNNFGRAFNQAADRADRIHFALDGILDDLPGAARRGSQGFFQGNYTNAEFSTIYRNPNLFSKTQFYVNNNPVSPLFRP